MTVHLEMNELREKIFTDMQTTAEAMRLALGPGESWKILLCSALAIMLPSIGDAEAARTLRTIADDVEKGVSKTTLN